MLSGSVMAIKERHLHDREAMETTQETAPHTQVPQMAYYRVTPNQDTTQKQADRHVCSTTNKAEGKTGTTSAPL